MQPMDFIQAGMTREDVFKVESEHSAAHVGSGSARVLATPWMIAFMERTARDLLGEVLPAGYSSVGVHVDVRHLAPSPIGSRVRSRVEVTAVQGVKVDFTVRLWDEQELVGEGTHQRVVIEEERFLRRVAGKIATQK
jgi:fluoroacetyl-CoA thioesterase